MQKGFRKKSYRMLDVTLGENVKWYKWVRVRKPGEKRVPLQYKSAILQLAERSHWLFCLFVFLRGPDFKLLSLTLHI